MAYNEIQVGRYLRGLQKFLSMKGNEPKEITLAPEVMPTLELPGAGVDILSTFGWDRWSRADTTAAVAAQNSAVKLRNPVGSNVLAVLDHLVLYEGAADTLRWFMSSDTTDFATISNGTPLDGRQVRTQPSCIASKGNNVVASIFNGQRTVLANTPVDWITTDIQSVVLSPGQSIVGLTTTVNVVLGWELMWRERFLEESERT